VAIGLQTLLVLRGDMLWLRAKFLSPYMCVIIAFGIVHNMT